MKILPQRMLGFAIGFVFLTGNGYAIGDQHGLFRSQSTQGPQWMGTAEIEAEEFRITVHPDYLDVELDWVFRVGGTAPEKHRDALEIVGNLNLVRNSVIVGMLTWWKGDILKGKLKTTEMARADYENLVQRDSDAPPPPRDPVLIEYGWGQDNYDISIFPVEFGETRKVRIHYLVPAEAVGGTLKAPYPHAFTPNAKVSLRAGSDVASYAIETWKEPILLTNKVLAPLSDADFSFQAYPGSLGAPTIQYIVPKLNEEPKGSRIYFGDVSNSALQGQAAHIVAMDSRKIISKIGLKEDFVILWRWNHIRLLEAFAGQIVGQSKLLKAFLAKLGSANKRVAMIIDKEGGERIVFTLSQAAGPEYLRMTDYLDSLAALDVRDPPMVGARPNYGLRAEFQKAQADFESAISAALALFEKNDHVRHLLLLTAGPIIIDDQSLPVSRAIDSSIQVASLADYAEGLGSDIKVEPADRALYWPGINASYVISSRPLNLEIEAVLGNGSRLCTLSVATPPDTANPYLGSRSEIEKHVFASPGLLPTVQWTIKRDNQVVARFEESADMVPVAHPLAMAQLMGASRALTPLASQLPRSMAAAVGFIDSSYSLVALEQDKLPVDEAARYAGSGVPDLNDGDIHALPQDLTPLPMPEWIRENPPQRIWNYSNTGFPGFTMWKNMRGGPEILVMDTMADGIPAPGAGQIGAFMPFPVASEIQATAGTGYPDYTREISAGMLSSKALPAVTPIAKIQGRMLLVTGAGLLPDAHGIVRLDVYDLRGSLLYSRNFTPAALRGELYIPLHEIAGRGGLCLVELKAGKERFRQILLLPSR